MSETKAEEKQARREAKQLWDQGRVLFSAGDYRRLREMDKRIIFLAPESEFGRQAETELANLSLDPRVLGALVGSALLYFLAWFYALM